MIEILTPLLGIFIRFVIPILFTLGFAYLLKRLDDGWRRESLERSAAMNGFKSSQKIKCWELRGCSKEKRAGCGAFKSEKPCWEVQRRQGRLRSECLHCLVIQKALLPEGI